MKITVYLEIGSKRTFAAALEWPGWSRSGRDESSALQALLDYAPRYAAAIRSARLSFHAPEDASAFTVVERLKGDATTDFGTPGRIPAGDGAPLDEAELRRLQSTLKACWRSFDEAVEAAKGKALRTGPRGGGRDLQKIVSHVVEAQAAYVSRLGWKSIPRGQRQPGPITRQSPNNEEQWEAALTALSAAAHGELPARGPRGGLHWPARYFVRRAAWHALDHAWEVQDRMN